MAFAFVLFAATACSTGLMDSAYSIGPTVSEINDMPPERARGVLADKTIMTFDPGTTYCTSTGKFVYCPTIPGHGTQVEYFAPSGHAFLWYPGNARPVPSSWKLVRTSAGERYDICFLYPSNSYNPFTRTHGGTWECRDLAEFARGVKEVRESDLFALSTGRIPFKLDADYTSFDDLLAEWKEK